MEHIPDPRSRIRHVGSESVPTSNGSNEIPLPTIGMPNLMVGVLASASSRQNATAPGYRQMEQQEEARREAEAQAVQAALQAAGGTMLEHLKIAPRE